MRVVSVCVCMCAGVKGCHSVHDINFIYAAYADVVSAGLFMLVSPFYVYLNFLVGPNQQQMKETAAQHKDKQRSAENKTEQRTKNYICICINKEIHNKLLSMGNEC